MEMEVDIAIHWEDDTDQSEMFNMEVNIAGEKHNYSVLKNNAEWFAEHLYSKFIAIAVREMVAN